MATLSASVKKRLTALARKNKIRPTSLFKVYRRGLGAAVSSGTRPGQTPSSWASARVNSFIKGGHKQASVDGRLVHNNRIFLIVARER